MNRTHHRALHRRGDEVAWWKATDIDSVLAAQRLWKQTRLGAKPLGARHPTEHGLLRQMREKRLVRTESMGRDNDSQVNALWCSMRFKWTA